MTEIRIDYLRDPLTGGQVLDGEGKSLLTKTMVTGDSPLCELIRQIIREELKAQAHEIAKDVAEELTRALRLERNIRNEKERMAAAK